MLLHTLQPALLQLQVPVFFVILLTAYISFSRTWAAVSRACPATPRAARFARTFGLWLLAVRARGATRLAEKPVCWGFPCLLPHTRTSGFCYGEAQAADGLAVRRFLNSFSGRCCYLLTRAEIPRFSVVCLKKLTPPKN